MLKKLVMGSALAALMAVPAFAQAFNPGWGSGNNTPAYYDAQGRLHARPLHQGGREAFAVAPRGAYAYVPRATGADRYVGQDWNVQDNTQHLNPSAY